MKIKKLEFETSKGRFVVEEANDKNLGRVLLKYITEEQASEIVDSLYTKEYCQSVGVRNLYSSCTGSYKHLNPIEALHSLIKSKGWYLENREPRFSPYDPRSKTGLHEWSEKDEVDRQWQQAESRTFHNPVIFKIK